MSSSSTSSSSRRKKLRTGLLLALAALAVMFALDYLLYARQGFLRTFGYNSLEGQIVRKVSRAPLYAQVSDVIFFGGSFVRFGIEQEAFFRRGIMPYNFGITGGGPVGAYYALKSIETELRQRANKPLVVLELVNTTLTLPGRKNTIWDERAHTSALLRDISDRWAELPALRSVGSDYNSPDFALRHLVLPSSVYRNESRALISHILNGDPTTWQGDYLGYEDLIGFSQLLQDQGENRVFPLNQFRPSAALAGQAYTRAEYADSKVLYVKRFIALAQEIGLPVAILSSPMPSVFDSDIEPYEALIAELQREYADLHFISTSMFRHTLKGRRDFLSGDSFGHLSIAGAERFSGVIADHLFPQGGDRASLAAKLAAVVERIDTPPLDKWKMGSGRILNGRIVGAGTAPSPFAASLDLLAESPDIVVEHSGEYIIEATVMGRNGGLQVEAAMLGKDGEIIIANYALVRLARPSGKIYLRLRPTQNKIKIRFTFYDNETASVEDVKIYRQLHLPKDGIPETRWRSWLPDRILARL